MVEYHCYNNISFRINVSMINDPVSNCHSILNMINDFASFDRKESFGFVFGSAAHTALYPKDSKKYCNFHKTTNHSDDECHAVKKASSSSGSTRVDISSSSTTCQWNSRNLPSGLGRPCRFCDADN